MSNPPYYTDQPTNTPQSNTNAQGQHQPPLFISYVTGVRPGTGQWDRVNRELNSTPVGSRATSGNHPEAAHSSSLARSRPRTEEATVYSDQDRRRIALPLPLPPPQIPHTSSVSRYSGNTRLGDSVQARQAAAPPQVPVGRMASAQVSGDIGKTPTPSQGSNGSCNSSDPSRPTLRQLWTGAVSSPSSNATSTNHRQTEEQILKGIVIDYLTHERFPNTVAVLLGLGSTPVQGTDDQEIDLPIAGAGKGKARDAAGADDGDDDVHMLSASTTLTSAHSTTSHLSAKLHAATSRISEEAQNRSKEGQDGAREARSDAETFVRQIEWRKEIREMILSGRITNATDLIRKHFPSVLDTSREERYRSRRSDGFGGEEDDEDMDEDEGDDDVEDDGDSVEGGMFRRSGILGSRSRISTNGNGKPPSSAVTGSGVASTSSAVTNSTNRYHTAHVTGFAAGPSGNAARGGTGSRFGIMTNASGNRSNGAGAGGPPHSTGDVQWTAHPRTTSSVVASDTSFASATAHHPPTQDLRIPDFPYAHTYDRPTLLALNLDIQEFVEGLRVLQQQVPSSPSEAVSLSNSLYDEGTTSGGVGNGTNTDGTTTKHYRPTIEHDQTMSSRPTTPTAAAATRKAARDAAILACLAHAARLDNATRRLRTREGRRYAQQVQDVCGLLAYTDMEASPLAGYLEQERRSRLADMVEGCIMASIGYPPHSILENLWQQDAYLWHPEHGHLTTNEIRLLNEDGEEGDEGKKMRELAVDLLYYEPLMGLS